MSYSENEQLNVVSKRLSSLQATFVSLEMDDHFLSEVDLLEFDIASVDADQRKDIRTALQDARTHATNSSVLESLQKRRICHFISKAENELMKEKVGIQAFFQPHMK